MKGYKQYTGPRTARRRLRRRLKSVILPAVVLVLLFFSAPAQSRTQAAASTPEPLWARPTKDNLAVARNYYALNGDNGDSHHYLKRWEEFTAYIIGEKDIDDLIELPDGTVMLPPEDGEVQR